ncbi:MAG TPA: NTP transferase domain-containing protein [Armatimonadota bacterium]
MTEQSSDFKLPAVILAGAPADAETAAKYGIDSRAAIPVAGKMMAEYIVEALCQSSHIADVTVVGNIDCAGVTRTIPPGNSLIENLVAGVKASSPEDDGQLVLVATSDIPLITSQAIDDLIGRCTDPNVDFYYPIIPKEANEKRFPEMKRTYAKLAEGTFTGGNIMLMKSGFVTRNADVIRDVFSARKSVIRLAKMIGFSTLVRAVIAQTIWPGAINLPLLERTAGRILNARVKAVQTPFAEIGADVDDAEQIKFAEAALRK